MRLLLAPDNTHLIQTKEFIGDEIPKLKYAILSHTWGAEAEEVSLQELNAPFESTDAKAAGFDKIHKACQRAKRDGLEYTWVDTCCIDKTSSAELTEAINSMYAWYAGAKVCYAYLSDLDPGADLETALPQCKWFTRGWTLQELIAPRHVIFFDRDWNEIGNKNENEIGNKNELSNLLSRITNIPVKLLHSQKPLEHYSVARRMSWAARRKTTRIEDLAYCLLGIFEVNLALIYGEGKKAFIRLQEAIVQSIGDRSIFAWTERRPDAPYQPLVGIFAEEPCQFADCGNIFCAFEDSVYGNLAITPRGVEVDAALAADPEQKDDAYRCIFNTHCTDKNRRVGIAVRKIGGGRYARYKPHMRVTFPDDRSFRIARPMQDFAECKFVETLTLATRISGKWPFKGNNAILGNRQCAFRVNWLATTPSITLLNLRPMPRSHWDYHDEVWISSTTASNGWCAFVAHGFIPLPDDCYIPIHILVSCHYWCLGEPQLIVASLDDMNPVMAAVLEAQLDVIGFERSRHVHRLLLQALGGKVDFEPQTSITERRVLIDGAVMRDKHVRNLPAAKQNDAGIRKRVEISAKLHRENDPDICSYPMWRLDMSCRVNREDAQG
ncbi:vegetative incompatibility protein HET-E-1 [Rhypophila decipiens]|uniref:Vegetative incompatibility protein HET-E-1 n=1 Tax=Rhypophila decipiens TaxID=261697 RepID=A0AAN7B333_9PEZI|nr:vegetative incompatibility protein HET-E-1 [Rhypophila decipiens]